MAKRRRTNFPIRTAKPQPPPREPIIDRLANWLGRWPRLLRMLLNLIIAAGLTGVIGLGVFSLLYRLPPDRLPLNTTSLVLLALSVVGIVLYWVGWRVLIGFNWEATPHQPGRAALLWVLFALLVFIATAALAIASAIDASKET
ncbi:MAG: hypothetical protein KF716_20770 [Anaerolineae bacterium]|nr:hypothetical protein [Anaerolineae bacterium]